jgi:hypothetical protein
MGRGAEMNRRNANAALPHQNLSPCIEMGAGRDANRLGLGAGKESASSCRASNLERQQDAALTVAQKGTGVSKPIAVHAVQKPDDVEPRYPRILKLCPRHR